MLDGKGEWKASWTGIGEGTVKIGEISADVPEDVKAEALALADQIGKKEYHPFTGPLQKQDGSEWLADGQRADDGTPSGLNFFVEGITAEYPK